MPFQIVRQDIVNMRVDAIVNTANPKPVIGHGCDTGIHQKAGPMLLNARKQIGEIPIGGVAVTPGYDLTAKYVFHAVGPAWQGGAAEEVPLLGQCYDKALRLALDCHCQSIAFPLLCAGNLGFPKAIALQTAINAISSFLMEHDMMVFLTVFDKASFVLSEKLFQSVAQYIDEHYLLHKTLEEYEADEADLAMKRSSRRAQVREEQVLYTMSAPCKAAISENLDKLLEKTDAGFSETLLKLIDKSGKKDSEIYKRANIDRKLFSKIRKNPAYKPTKSTALAFAIALELDLAETRDLIGRAGYALSHSSKFDIIVEYFLKTGNYNVFEVNEVLFYYDQPLIGGQ